MQKYGTVHDSCDENRVEQSEVYVEFTRDGKIKRQTKKTIAVSKYPEDQFNGNHSSVWGSWWNEVLGWGYACCHSNQKHSPCMGQKGKKNALIKEYRIKKERDL